MMLFVKELSALDVSLWCPRRGLVGASYHIDVELEGELGEDGMLFDFGEVKPWIKSRIDDSLDHTLLVPTEAAGVEIEECREGLRLRTRAPWTLEMRAPRQAYSLLPWPEISVPRLEARLSHELSRRPPPRVSQIRVRLREESIEGAGYTYSHGLRRHQGNCQRIAHGHRSRLAIHHNGERSPVLERRWAQRLGDIYLADREDVLRHQEQRCRIAYDAPQGHFVIELPTERVEILPSATTVECIANWIARESATMVGGSVQVQAFEGIDKGAVATARSA